MASAPRSLPGGRRGQQRRVPRAARPHDRVHERRSRHELDRARARGPEAAAQRHPGRRLAPRRDGRARARHRVRRRCRAEPRRGRGSTASASARSRLTSSRCRATTRCARCARSTSRPSATDVRPVGAGDHRRGRARACSSPSEQIMRCASRPTVDRSRPRWSPTARRHVFLAGRRWDLELFDPLDIEASSDVAEGGLRAPMPGKVVAHLIAPGTKVARARR